MTDFHFPYGKRIDREENLPSVLSLYIFPVWPPQIVQPPFSLRGRVQTAAGGNEERLTFICSLLTLFSILWAWETYECVTPWGSVSTHCPDEKITETPVRLCEFHVAD